MYIVNGLSPNPGSLSFIGFFVIIVRCGCGKNKMKTVSCFQI